MTPQHDRQDPTSPDRTTEQLAALPSGRREALDGVLPLVYEQLRRAARRELAAWPSDTLGPTALVHELYVRLAQSRGPSWRSRSQLLATAAVAMRHVLVDHARRRTADKRGGARRAVTLDDSLGADVAAAHRDAAALLDLHDALEALAHFDARLARVVECRFFGDMTECETAELLGVTGRTVRRDWIKARGFLHQALTGRRGPDDAGGASGLAPAPGRRVAEAVP